jgi:4-hydroxythreonine-4-phosphate dehydrogenase
LSHKDRPRLALTLGDPAGIGTEVVLKAIADPKIQEAAEITLVGNISLLKQRSHQLQLALPSLQLLAVESVEPIELGQPSAASGNLSFRFLAQAIAATLAGEFAGIVTAPISKAAWAAAGHYYPGQTELLAEMARLDSPKFDASRTVGMMFVGRSPHTGWQLKALLATTHIPLQEVSRRLTPELLSSKLALLVKTLERDFGLPEPTIAIAGLNPHSGEQGQLGREEVDWLNDWLHSQQQKYPQVKLQGLLPPDTMWVAPGQAWFGTGSAPVADCYLALYHDQGLIPVKLMAFDRAVNTTIGLPFVRTSPDHGTAFDIATKGIADATSMKEAILLAADLAERRSKSHDLD